MQDLMWIDVEKQSITDNFETDLLVNVCGKGAFHARRIMSTYWWGTEHKIKSYPNNKSFAMPITHWCIPSLDLDDWNDMDTLPDDINSEFLVIDDAGVIKHVYLNKYGNYGNLQLMPSPGKLKSTPVGWLNLPEFED